MSIKGMYIKEMVRRIQEEKDNICLLPNTEPSVKLEGRPCNIRGKKAFFHTWTEKNGRPYAIVEWENGCVELVTPGKVRFTDRLTLEDRIRLIREDLEASPKGHRQSHETEGRQRAKVESWIHQLCQRYKGENE